jgi:hypothetical protein
MKFDVGRSGPASMRCDIYLEGEDDPPYVRIHRNGTLVAEVACGMVSDAETMQEEVRLARRLEKFPRLLHSALSEMAGDYAGACDDGSPEQRRQKYAGGFLAAIRGEKPDKPMSQSWLKGYEAGQMILGEANALTLAFRDGRNFPVK